MTLFVKDHRGRYREASMDEASTIIAEQVRRTTIGELINSPACSRSIFSSMLQGREHEVFVVMFLTNRNRVITIKEMFHGTIDGASVHPREVVKTALHVNAGTAIVAHNHPSGDPTPSLSDKSLTKRLVEALNLVDVRVLDHIIVGRESTFSFAERGLL